MYYNVIMDIVRASMRGEKPRKKEKKAMKLLSKRSLAWLTSLLMLVSLFTAVVVLPAEAATVDYVYSGSYVYNWGQREEVATFLSPKAEAWYEKNNVTYEELAALSGSATQSSVPSSALYQELKSLMSSNQNHVTSYSETKNLFRYTDCENSGGKISSFYSGKAIGPTWDGGWNREHTWPNSKGDGDAENDIMMLRPTSTSENSSRGNKAYGESSSYYNPNSESGGQHDLRGDVARIMLYVYCRWGNTSKMWGASGVMESRAVLLKWVEEDPVDTWELGRNDAVECITGTRNVFVDYPELIFIMFGEDVPTDYQSPSGKASEGAYAITASVNNAAYGSVTVSGKKITASPNTGYAVSGYTILSGEASVVRSGNVFTVNATTDVSIRIDFAPRAQVQVGFAQDGQVVDTLTVYSGDAVTLPDHNGAVDEGLSFVGWVETEMADTTAMPTFYAVGSSYTVGKDTVLHAMYSRTEMDGGSLSNVFEPYSGVLTEGDYILVFDGKALTGAVTDKTRLQITEVSLTNGNVIAPADDVVWHIASNGGNWTLKNLATDTYAAGTGYKSSNQATLIATLTDYAKWTVEVKSTGYEFTNVGNDAAGVNPLLRYNPSVDAFACYAKNTNVGGPNKLYKRAGGTTYYFTQVSEPCDHQYEETAGQGASCGEDGSVTYLCRLCGREYTEIIPATGDHAYESAVTDEPTCGQEGVLTYTCTVCGDSYTEAIPATGEHVYEDDYDEECDECGDLREVPDKPAYQQGDINGDGSVNNRDLAALQKYLNEWEVVVVEEMLDVNGDGSVNNRDLAALQKILNA